MSIYQFSYDKQITNLLPPDKRMPKMLAWLKALGKQLEYCRVQLFDVYKPDVDKRIKFTGQSLVLDYAINDVFGGTFRQPPLQSDIYFTKSPANIPPFVVGGSQPTNVYTLISDGYCINYYDVTTTEMFTINIPTAIWTALSTDVDARTKIINNFVNKYLPAGITYTIATY